MKKIKSVIPIILWALPFILHAQLTIEECQEKARINYPLIKQYDLIEKSKEYNLLNAGKGYLPQFSLSAKASYQTQVTEIPIKIPGVDIQGPNKDQYGITLDVSQTIWDGGVISSRKNVLKTNADVQHKKLEVDLYTVTERVNSLFFGILLLDANIIQNDLYQQELTRNYNLIYSYMENGIANQADVDVIKVEQLNALQKQIQLKANRKAYTEMLSTLINYPVTDSTILIRPDTESIISNLSNEVNRPEIQLFEAQLNNLEGQKRLLKTGHLPRLGLFATGGYGNPGLNMLKPEFSAYFMGGIRLSWNFGGLYTYKNEKRLVEINQNNILTMRETFLFNNNLESIQKLNEINKNQDLLEYDNEIITLRNNIKRAAEAKVTNGTMSVSDLMKEIIREDMAKQDKISHEIELLQSVYGLKYITNNMNQ